MFHVASKDGVSVAVHELAGTIDLPPLLISHATGFHAHCYMPIARALGHRFRVLALDFHGHGETAPVPNWSIDWTHFGDDATAVSEVLAPNGGLVGFGHSMGAAALMMAAHRRPNLFSKLVVFEPIAHIPGQFDLPDDEMRRLPIIAGALRRRSRFPSFEAAYHHYQAKLPMSLMVDEVLRNYVDYGFHSIVDEDDLPAIELRCTPAAEAGIFMRGRDNGVWALLSEIFTPVVVVGGHVEEMQPSAETEAIANQLPNGEYLLLEHQSHFGPFSHPDQVASIIDQHC